MRKIIFICLGFCLFLSNLGAKDLIPNYSLTTSGGVTDLVLKNEHLYVATTASSVDIFDLKTKEKIDSIIIPKIKDFMNESIDARVYSIDIFDNNLLILSQGESGGRNIDIYKDGKLHKIIEDKDRLFIAYAKFIDENYIIYALLSNQIYLYDIKNKKIITETQISQSKFSNFKLNENKTKLVVADESGILTIINTKDLSQVKKFDTLNLDNVFQVDIKNDVIITAGQDRRCVI